MSSHATDLAYAKSSSSSSYLLTWPQSQNHSRVLLSLNAAGLMNASVSESRVSRGLGQLSLVHIPAHYWCLLCLCSHRAEALSNAFVWRLSVWRLCLSRTSGLTREQRGLGRLNWHRAHVTCNSDTSFKVKGQLVVDVLNSQHARIGATWRLNTKILSTCRGGGISWRPSACCVCVSWQCVYTVV